MFYYIENPEADINFSGTGIRSIPPDEINWDSLLIPEQFQIDSLFNIMFYTYHVASKQPQILMYQVTPEQSLYISCEGEETEQVVSFLKLHHHDFYELLFVIDGEIYQNIEHTRHLYPKGSCCLLNKNVYHTEEYVGDHRICFLQFSSELISHIISSPLFFSQENSESFQQMREFFQAELSDTVSNNKNYMDFIPLQNEDWIKAHIHHCFEKILLETGNPTAGSSMHILAHLMELLCWLFDEKYYQHTPIHFGSEKERTLFDAITQCFQESHGRISRRELEIKLNYSGDYLYKVVQKYTGLSLFSYGMHFCLKEAADLLSTTSLPVQEIARILKFTNMTHFYKLFEQEYHMTPREYRKRN